MNNKSISNTAILGATGIIGQVFVHLLSNHPFFRIKSLIASKTREGKKYGEETTWHLPFPPEESVTARELESLDVNSLKKNGVKYIFSALPATIALKIETALRNKGFYIFSNSSAFRNDKNVPILIPDVNKDYIELIEKQGYPGKGFIITNPNCSTAGLALALSPLIDLEIKEINVSTYQAISGAGYPGIPSLDISDTVIPFIKDEEEKICFEIKKILKINPTILATCVRVPVRFGHVESVWIKTEVTPKPHEIIDKWLKKSSLGILPSLPDHPIVYGKEDGFPGNQLTFLGNPPGMQIYIGGLRIREGRIGFNLLVNNIFRGGAAGSVANAEYFKTTYES